tara:strand:- start:160 stop:546 length:387 start_codon:yes stop_codon:yes gene_type:complete
MSKTMSQPNEYDSIDELDELDELELQEMLEFKKRNEAETKKTCLQLQNLFHMAMLMGFLHLLKTKEKMMDYLNTRGDKEWTSDYIWTLADMNKINWVKGSDDPTPYEKYKEKMNQALAKILHPSSVVI